MMHWKNPETSPKVTYDGFRVAYRPVITYDTAGTTAPKAFWSIATKSDGGSSIIDLKPDADYKFTVYDQADASATNVCDNKTKNDFPGLWTEGLGTGKIEPSNIPATGVCEEAWVIGKSGYACVKLSAYM